MNLINYVKEVNDFLQKNPELGELELYTSLDDEGNYYKSIDYMYATKMFILKQDSGRSTLEGVYDPDDLDKDEEYIPILVLD